jgi:hypothetical protein
LDAGFDHELHRLTQDRRSWAQGFGLASVNKSCSPVKLNRRQMAARDANPNGKYANGFGPFEHGSQQQPTHALSSSLR